MLHYGGAERSRTLARSLLCVAPSSCARPFHYALSMMLFSPAAQYSPTFRLPLPHDVIIDVAAPPFPQTKEISHKMSSSEDAHTRARDCLSEARPAPRLRLPLRLRGYLQPRRRDGGGRWPSDARARLLMPHD